MPCALALITWARCYIPFFPAIAAALRDLCRIFTLTIWNLNLISILILWPILKPLLLMPASPAFCSHPFWCIYSARAFPYSIFSFSYRSVYLTSPPLSSQAATNFALLRWNATILFSPKEPPEQAERIKSDQEHLTFHQHVPLATANLLLWYWKWNSGPLIEK